MICSSINLLYIPNNVETTLNISVREIVYFYGPQVPVTNDLDSPIPLYILYNSTTPFLYRCQIMREKHNKNASIATKTIFKSVHKTLFHKLKPFIGSCYNLHTRYVNSKSKKRL